MNTDTFTADLPYIRIDPPAEPTYIDLDAVALDFDTGAAVVEWDEHIKDH